MNINELRMGITVLWQGRPTTIKNAYELHNAITDTINTEPIPLSGDWLIKLGGRKSQERDDFFWLGGLVILIDKDGDFCIRKSIERGDTVYLNHLKYVHQLQNLHFALTGQELQVNEPKAQ